MDGETTVETTDVETEDTTETVENMRKLRSEAKALRERTKASEARTEELSRALFTARVEATGRVANPAEIAYAPDLLDDSDALNAAIDAAIEARPYIRRTVTGDAGQGQRSENLTPTDFSGLFR